MIIHHHLGLGDHFVCNGIVNYLSKHNANIDLICKEHNFPTVNTLYSDNVNVNVIPINFDRHNEIFLVNKYARETNQEVLRIGFDKLDCSHWDKSFYQQLNISFDYRYSLFSLPKILPTQINVPNIPYIFVHNSSSDQIYELKIDSKLYCFVAQKRDGNNVLSYMDLITNAAEIHCINSSLFHLIDSISCQTEKIYYHDLRKHPCHFDVSDKWKIISY